MNLYKFKYFTYVYFVFILFVLFISLLIKRYDFLLGVYIFTIPVLVVGFITNWVTTSERDINKKLFNDLLLHWIPFLSFMYIIFIIKPLVVNPLWFWIGYTSVLLTLVVYFVANGDVNGLENNYSLKAFESITIFTCVLIVSTIFTYFKLFPRK